MEARERLERELALLGNLQAQREDLRSLLDRASNHWGYEDPVYRFYHQSFKVFGVQETTAAIVRCLRALAPDCQLDPWFLSIVSDGTGHVFAASDNAAWPTVARPVIEAFFHARFFLEMAVRYSDFEAPPSPTIITAFPQMSLSPGTRLGAYEIPVSWAPVAPLRSLTFGASFGEVSP